MRKNNIDIAEEAKAYARELLLEGYTQMKNNNYSKEKNNSLKAAVDQVRKAYGELDTADPYGLEVKTALYLFEKKIEILKKYSLGNCAELAVMALHYMIWKHPEINSEVYGIAGGDHVYLVIGRDLGSNLHNPDTWGENAYICDPWSDKVFKAEQYKTELRNYFYGETPTGWKNHTEELNLNRHRLSPIAAYSSKRLGAESRNFLIKSLIASYKKKLTTVYEAFTQLKSDLSNIADRIERKYSKKDLKYQPLQEKVEILEEAVAKISEELKKELYSEKSRGETRRDLFSRLVLTVKELNKSSQFSEDASRVIHTYHDKNSCKTLMMRLFNRKPKSVREVRASFEKVNKKMESMQSTSVNNS